VGVMSFWKIPSEDFEAANKEIAEIMNEGVDAMALRIVKERGQGGVMRDDRELILAVPEGPFIIDELTIDELTIDERLQRTKACVKACAGLKDPEKQIKALVEAVEHMLYVIDGYDDTKDLVRSALEPFKDKC